MMARLGGIMHPNARQLTQLAAGPQTMVVGVMSA